VQAVSGLSPNPVDVIGVEVIRYEGVDDQDTLTVDPGQGDNTVRIERGAGVDVVESDSLPLIEFANLDRFVLDADDGGLFGADVVTFVTRSLDGATHANYEISADETDTLIIEGNDGSRDAYTVSNPLGAASVAIADTEVTQDVVVTETSGNLGRLQINTLGGDDEVTVDVGSTDLVNVPITYDGGSNSDSLIVSGTPATPVATVEYSPGPDVTEGRLAYNTDDMLIDFVNLEPVIDLVPAASLIVNGTNADNAITYTGNGANGQVTVDGFESIEFSNKTVLVLNGGAGDDTITLNSNVAPAGLAGITVNGGDSNHGDNLLVNNNDNGTDINVSALTVDGAFITGAQLVPVTADTVESIDIDGDGVGDSLNVTTPLFGNTITYTPGSTVDSGDVLVDSLVPLHFENLGADLGGVQASLIFSDAGGVRADMLVHRGSDVNDDFDISGADPNGLVLLTNSPGLHVPVLAPGVSGLTVEGLAGDDSFVVDGSHPFGLINVNGGSPDDGDTLTVTSPTATPTVDLGLDIVLGYGGVIVYTGLQTVLADAGGGAINLRASLEDDEVVVTPLTATTGVAQANGDDPVVQYFNTGGVLGATLVVNTLSGQDRLIVNATTAEDQVVVDGPNQFVDTGANGGIVEFINANLEAMTVNGLEGDDVFDVTPTL
jgi:hypothetical protein